MKLMFKIQFLCFVLLLASAGLYAQQQVKEVERHLRQDIGVFAHDSMFGREAGTPSEYKAAKYIEESFRASKLRPFDLGTGSYLKPFAFNNYRFVSSVFGVNGHQYKSGDKFGAVAGSSDGTIKDGKVVEFIPSQGTLHSNEKKSYAGMVVLLDMNSKTINQKESYQWTLESVKECILDGAAAILLYNAWEKDFSQRLFNADSMPSFSVPVMYLTAEVAKELKKTTDPICSIEVKINRKRPEAHNVIGFLDNGAKRTVVIGGHFDHVGTPGSIDPKIGDPNIHNGADDNASGAAAVMELARWASQQQGMKYNYLFIAFSAEEKGLFGSWNFCNSADFGKYDIAWMLNLDMVGRLGWKGKGKDKLTVLGMASSRKWKELISTTLHTGLQLKKLKGAPGFSDHYPFLKHNIPVIYFTTGSEKEYHKPADDVQLINFEGEAVIIEYLERLIMNTEKTGDPGFRKIGFWQDVRAVIFEFILD
jgi:aminopeptidase YwaD